MKRNTKQYTPEQRQKIMAKVADLMASGMNAFNACKEVGVSGPTYYEWKRKALEAKEPKIVAYSGKSAATARPYNKKPKVSPATGTLALVIGTPEQLRDFMRTM